MTSTYDSLAPTTSLPPKVGELLFERLPDALLLLSAEGEIVRRNAAAESLKNDLAEIVGQSSSQRPTEIRSSDGGWMEVTAEPVDGGFLIRIRDISKLKEAEAAVRRRDERARLIIKSTNDILWWADPERGFVEPQEPWEEFTGQKFDEYKHWGHVLAIHPDDRDRVQAAWFAAAAEKRVCTCEYRVYCPGKGEYRHCLARGVPMLDSEGEICEWVGTLCDIHDLKMAQAALAELNHDLEVRVRERTDELKLAIQELESLTYACSHDLRSYIRGVIANCRFLQETCESLDEESTAIVAQISGNAMRLAQLVDDLLAFSRLRREPIAFERVDVTKLVREAVSSIPAREGVTFRIEEPMFIRADASLMRNALFCLLDNASKFSPQGGEVAVSLRREGDRSVLRVEDPGIGFDEAFLPRALLPFERLQNDRRFSGTGIGLAKVQWIVERHGGSLNGRSSLGRGSTFEIVLPATPHPVEDWS